VNLLLSCTPFQQRLGFVNVAVALAGYDVFTSRELLAKKLFEKVRTRQEKWVEKLQSKTGAISSPETAGDIVDWSVSLDLLFNTTFSWRPYARVADTLITQEEYDAIHGEGTDNPLGLRLPSQIFYLYLLLKFDGAALVYLTKAMNGKSEWTRKDASEALPEIYRKYGELHLSLASSNVGRIEATKFVETSKSMVEGARLHPDHLGTKELRVTTRTESLVDLGILEKPPDKKGSFVYRSTERLNRFLRKFCDWSESLAEVESNFFRRCSYVYDIQATNAEEEVVFETIMNNYEPLKASYGLAGIDEICLLSCIDLLTEKTPMIVEMDSARNILLEKQKELQSQIKLYPDSRGRIRYFSARKDFVSGFKT